MIRINLLKPLAPQAPAPLIFEDHGGRRKKSVFILGGLALVAVAAIAVLQFPTLFGGLFAKKEVVEAEKASPAPHRPKKHVPPKQVTENAVEETVRNVQDDQAREQATPSYGKMVPSQKIEFQYYAADRVLRDIKTVTPPDVGFANFIFTPPGDFYVHGLAADEQSLQRFQQGLSGLAGASVKPGLNVPAGAHGKAKEFSFYTSVKYPLDAIQTPPDHVMDKAGVQKELKQLKTVANGLGIHLKEPKLSNTSPAGDVNRMVYQTSGDCNFQQMQDLLNALHEGKSNLGVIKFALHAKGDEKVVADLDLLAYVHP
jgi:hypothetical protein